MAKLNEEVIVIKISEMLKDADPIRPLLPPEMLANLEPVHTHLFDGNRYDAGTPLGLMKTGIELALQNPLYRSEVLDWIQNLKF